MAEQAVALARVLDPGFPRAAPGAVTKRLHFAGIDKGVLDATLGEHARDAIGGVCRRQTLSVIAMPGRAKAISSRLNATSACPINARAGAD